MANWRLVDTGFSDCFTNMAVDEAMLTEFAVGRIPPTLRIYGWRPAAFSLGCSQNPALELDIDKCRQHNVSFVRRMTGGSIIYHDNELTYSLICRAEDISSDYSIRESYRASCSFIINAYKRLGLYAEFSGLKTQEEGRSFCFAGREKYDIVIKGKKLGGNAQKRQRDIIFQHGSIPLKLDMDKAFYFLKEPPLEAMKNVCSLGNVLGREIGFPELRDVVKDSFCRTFRVMLSEEALTYKEKELSLRLKTEKYQTADWNLLRYADADKKARVA